MARKLIGLLFSLGVLFAAETIEVSADHINSNQAQKKVIMSGNVVIKRQEDQLKANQVIIYLADNKKPSKYEAIGKVSFRVKTDDGRIVEGTGQKVVYDALKEEYRLVGKARLQEKAKENAIRGEIIIFNRKNGSASIEGNKKKPAKIIFSLEKGDQ